MKILHFIAQWFLRQRIARLEQRIESDRYWLTNVLPRVRRAIKHQLDRNIDTLHELYIVEQKNTDAQWLQAKEDNNCGIKTADGR